MKVTVDMENLGSLVQEAIEQNLNNVVEQEICKTIERNVATNVTETIENVVNEKLKSYVDEYIKSATISVGGGWNSAPEVYTVEAYIKKQISEIMDTQCFKVVDRYGSKKTMSFEDYMKNEFDVSSYVQKELKKFMEEVKNNINQNVNAMFNHTTQAALSSAVLNLLTNNSTFMDMQENIRRITDGR